jgi:hypothetical protein
MDTISRATDSTPSHERLTLPASCQTAAARPQTPHVRRSNGPASVASSRLRRPLRAQEGRGTACGTEAREARGRRFPTGLTAALALAVALALVAATPGCGAPRAYQPDTNMVAKLGHDEAVARLRTLLGRAESPTVSEVHVTDEHIDLVWLDTRQTSRWRFRAIESIDIRTSDHVVTLRLENKRYIYRIDFTTDADATAFVDLVASFYRARGSAEVELPPITRDRERP